MQLRTLGAKLFIKQQTPQEIATKCSLNCEILCEARIECLPCLFKNDLISRRRFQQLEDARLARMLARQLLNFLLPAIPCAPKKRRHTKQELPKALVWTQRRARP